MLARSSTFLASRGLGRRLASTYTKVHIPLFAIHPMSKYNMTSTLQSLKETLTDVIPAKQEQLKNLVRLETYIHR